MANGEQHINGSSDKNSYHPSNKDLQDEQVSEMAGWLMKRSKISHKWKKQWFHLKKTEICYGNSAEVWHHFQIIVFLFGLTS